MAYCHIPKECRSKFDSKVKKCIMLGYAQTGYRLWDLENHKLIIARDVNFNENEFWYKGNKCMEYSESLNETDINEETEAGSRETDKNESTNEDKMKSEIGNESESKRIVKKPTRFDDYELYMAFDACSFVENVPTSFEEIKGRVDRDRWLEAIETELKAIENNETWEKIEKPVNKQILDTKWVFNFKSMEENEIDKFKERLVVRGFAQKGSDYNEIYSPVAKMTTIRALLILGNQLGYFSSNWM